MFESIIICKEQNIKAHKPIDLGSLAEALLFYQSVNVIAEPSILRQLITECGYDTLLELIEQGFLKLSYLENFVGINYNGKYENICREPCLYENPKLSLQEYAPQLLQELTGKSGKARRMANRLSRQIETVKIEQSIRDDIFEDFSDSEYLTQSIGLFLSCYAPEYKNPGDILFSIIREDSNLRIETNIDFAKANSNYHLRIPPSHSTLSAAYFLSLFSNIRKDLYFASNYSSEISTFEMHSKIFTLKFAGLLKHIGSMEKIEVFQDFVFNEAKSIRDAINSGMRDFKDMLALLEEAKKFKHWIRGKDVDASLLKEYYNEVTKKSWADKLPNKIARWSIFAACGIAIDLYTGGSGVGTVAGLTLSATDAFLFERIINGWKPNHFIEGPLEGFVG